MNLKERIESDNIRAEVKSGAPAWDNADGWCVTLINGAGQQLTLPFTTGYGLRENGVPVAPSAADVLDAVLSDVAGYLNADRFEDWAGEYGFDTDTRTAEAIYDRVGIRTAEMRAFLGDSFDAYVWETDRD